MMDGQWIGRVEGDVPGLGILELDDNGTYLDGIAYHFPDDSTLPSVAAYIVEAKRVERQTISAARLVPVQPTMGVWLPHQNLAEHFPETIVANSAQVELKFNTSSVDISYKTEVTAGFGILNKSRANEASELIPNYVINTWDEFKHAALSADPGRHMYRGQCVRNRLRTSFHRTRRKNLARFRDEDISELRRALSSQLRHVFDPRDSLQTGALYNLLQHHGYPTPLLDWSLSPFVAAFFAFRAPVGSRPASDYVRIFSFDRRDWQRDTFQSALVAYTMPHVSVIELLGIENLRMVPQQAIATISNIDDIESHIRNIESINKKSYLTVVDLPLPERNQALSELSLMGINAGSMFPGIDGSCEALAYKNFWA